jgi:hypothetical protein
LTVKISVNVSTVSFATVLRPLPRGLRAGSVAVAEKMTQYSRSFEWPTHLEKKKYVVNVHEHAGRILRSACRQLWGVDSGVVPCISEETVHTTDANVGGMPAAPACMRSYVWERGIARIWVLRTRCALGR